MNTFGDRLRASMLASGISTAAQLGERREVARSTAEKWLAMRTARLSGDRLYDLAMLLNTRMSWFCSGQGPIAKPERMEEAVVILDRMTPEQAERWLGDGRRMAGLV